MAYSLLYNHHSLGLLVTVEWVCALKRRVILVTQTPVGIKALILQSTWHLHLLISLSLTSTPPAISKVCVKRVHIKAWHFTALMLTHSYLDEGMMLTTSVFASVGCLFQRMITLNFSDALKLFFSILKQQNYH